MRLKRLFCIVLICCFVNLAFSDSCVSPPLECPNENVTFWLYTSSTQDDPTQLFTDDSESFKNAPFNKDAPIKILIHGYTGWKDYAPNAEIRPAYFERGEYNVISVDWNPIAREPCYTQAAKNTQLVGKCVAQLIDTMVQDHGYPLPQFHVIGFSLGAQSAGAISNYLQSGQLDRLTGLDPAMPLFVTPDTRMKLDSSDAKFVDVLHTNALARGKLEPSGDVDFFANGGMSQPGCSNQEGMSKSSCDHWRAPVYYAESINSDMGFYGTRCFSWIAYMIGWCDIVNQGDEELYGEYLSSEATGLYFFRTNSKSPFARGSNKNNDEYSATDDERDRETLADDIITTNNMERLEESMTDKLNYFWP